MSGIEAVLGRPAFKIPSEPLACPFCGQTFDRYLREALQAFQQVRDKLKDAGCEIVFRVAESPPASVGR